MRIIGGEFSGRSLATGINSRQSRGLRPTSTRARTVMFDLLTHGAGGNHVVGARVLDLFSGTGALGIEALSRGATYAAFVDRQRLARRVICRNIAHVGMESQTAVLQCDASRLGNNADSVFSLLFLDPPYQQSGLAELSVLSAVAGDWIKPGSVVVAETPSPLRMKDCLSLIAERRVGPAWIGVFVVSARSC